MAGSHSDMKDEKYLGDDGSHQAIAADDDSEYQEYLVLAEEFSGAALTKLTVRGFLQRGSTTDGSAKSIGELSPNSSSFTCCHTLIAVMWGMLGYSAPNRIPA
jgi:hypothetical protein